MLNALFGVVRTEGRKGRTSVTASVEDFCTKQTRVRLNFVDKRFRSAKTGQQATEESLIRNPKICANAFEKIGEAIFIRASQK